MRTFDLGKTYYLNSALDDGVNEELATLPLYAPVEVTEVRPDGDGEVWVRSKRDGTRSGYVLARAILDDIPGAADLREAKAGDRVMILDAYGIEHHVQWCPFGIVDGLQDQPGRLRFRFEDDQNYTWYAEDWTLDVQDAEAEETPEESVGDVAGSVASLSVALDRTEEARQAALADLESFKRQVRENVIYQHQSKGWKDEHVNDLLESLELDPIKPVYDGPVHVGSIIRLNDGQVAVICDTSDEPFRAFRPTCNDPLTEWLAVADVVRIGVDYEIHNNEHFAENYIEV